MSTTKEDRLQRKLQAKGAKAAKFNNKATNINSDSQSKFKSKPKTDPDKIYDPNVCESNWYNYWNQNGFFRPNIDDNKEIFTMIMPPPNVTGSLHIGHALTISIEDFMARWHRMHGHSVLWIPGTDHAGIATQSIVEKKLYKDFSKTKNDIGRDEFLKLVWSWKNQYGTKICDQIKRLGASVDWSREVFTLDDKFTLAVNEAFIKCFESGLVTRSDRLINWCCSLRTCISNIECDKLEIKEPTTIEVNGKPYIFGQIYLIAYKVVGLDTMDLEIVVSTTRPETIFGDVAIAVHPDDDRYKHLHGCQVMHPFLDKKLDIICDPILVKPNFGTGAVKVTPGHDVDDFECGCRYNLPIINILNDDGTLNNNADKFNGMFRFDARVQVIDLLSEMGLFRGVNAHCCTLKICSRSGDIIEPIIKPQWWIDMTQMAKRAVDAVKNSDLIINPKEKEADWFAYLNNIEPWCVSRQLWWGHQIPVYLYWQKGDQQPSLNDSKSWVAAHDINLAIIKASKLLGCDESNVCVAQDLDVLDTWFSSALYPFASVGWPAKTWAIEDSQSNLPLCGQGKTVDFEKYYPNQIIETGYDILFFWVGKMVMMGLFLTDKLPFNEILLHGMVRDPHGEKMSKSKGNVIDPLFVINGATLTELNASISTGNLPQQQRNKAIETQNKMFPNGIRKFGTDALRFALLSYTSEAKDINFDISRVASGFAFCNKIWNTYKLAEIIKLDHPLDIKLDLSTLTNNSDRWIISKYCQCLLVVEKSFIERNFMEICCSLRNFWLHDLCDVYLEIIKKDGYNHVNTLYMILESALRALHPIMPFITESLWQKIPIAKFQPSICIASYPKSCEYFVDEILVDIYAIMIKLVADIRSLYVSRGYNWRHTINCRVYGKWLDILSGYEKEIMILTNLSNIQLIDTELLKKIIIPDCPLINNDLYIELEKID